MSDDRARLEAELEKVKQEMARLQAQLSGEGAIAQGEGTRAAAATQGSVAVAGDVRGNVYMGPPPANPTEALNIYCRVLRQSCGHLPLRGVDVGASDPTANQNPLNLVNVYIALDTTSQAATEDMKETARSPEQKARPLGALEAVVANRHLVLLGDPGSGKTTLVSQLAHCLAAHMLEPKAGWLENHLSLWPAGEKDTLPLVLILRDFAQMLPDPLPRQAEAHHLWDFMEARLAAQKLAFAGEPIEKIMEQGRMLVLLDGLDEVPSTTLRLFVRDAARAFMERYPANRYMVTCRTLSYQPPVEPEEPDLRLPATIPSFELAPFDLVKINRFIEAWYTELVDLGSVREQDRAGMTGQLQQAVQQPDLWQLASNPLLLTVMALVHTHQGRLPDARALLYEETVDILLWRWEQVKRSGQSQTPRLRQLLRQAERSEMDLKKVLWRLAYEAHAQGGATDKPEQLADIGELKLQKALSALNRSDLNWARQLLETMKLRAGLLLERVPEVFTFPHRTFQEYLAGAYLASQPKFARQATSRAEEGALWREVILLAVGRLVYREGDTDKPLALVGELCPVEIGTGEVGWRKAWLAGEVLLEIGLNRVRDSALGLDLHRRVREQLAALLTEGHLPPRERVTSGDVLARLGDPRPGVGLRSDGLPDIAWCKISAGPFVMGSDKAKDSLAYDDEMPQHKVDLPAFYIAKYPVTNTQYGAFVADGGYSEKWQQCWTGWQWKGDRSKPETYGGVFDLPNHPVVMVSWYEAVAYCNWLTLKLRKSGDLGDNHTITLPSEAQWEKAARGTDARIYPWGDEIDSNRVNYSETGIGTTSAVGCFPEGAGPYGCLDMAGNVWEWCATKWQGSYKGYKADNDPAGDLPRVVRGGSFFDDRSSVRCAIRRRLVPDDRDRLQSFRVMMIVGEME